MGTDKFSKCNMRVDPRYRCDVYGCGKHHHKSLFDATSSFLAHVMATVDRYSSATTSEEALLTVQTIPACGLSINCLLEILLHVVSVPNLLLSLLISLVTRSTWAFQKSAVYYNPTWQQQYYTQKFRLFTKIKFWKGLPS